MTVTRVASQASGTNANNVTSISKAFPGNVTSGNLIVVCVDRFSITSHTMVAGDCTKSAGTATLGAISLDVTEEYNDRAGVYDAVAIWSATVTGTGSLTMQVAGQPSGSYINIGVEEYATTATWGSGRLVGSNHTHAASGSPSAPNPGSASSTGAAAFVGVFDCLATTGTITITPNASYTAIFTDTNANSNQPGGSEDRIVSGSTTDSGTWVAPTGYGWVAALAVYQETVVGVGKLFRAANLSGLQTGGPFFVNPLG